MLMVILGAGASFDLSAEYLPHRDMSGGGERAGCRPPLTDDLFRGRFREIRALFPEMDPIVPKLLKSVEQGLGEFEAQGHNPERIRQLMAVRHYVPRVIGACEERWVAEKGRATNHLGLLDAVIDWCLKNRERVCFVTFNYDTLIERAFGDSQLRMRMEKLDDYIKDDTYKLIKPHGSITWCRPLKRPVVSTGGTPEEIVREVIGRAGEGVDYGDLLVAKRDAIGKIGASGPVVVPGIAIPVQEKPGERFECPPDHVEALRNCIPLVSKMMLIGWAGKEDNVLGMLRNLPLDVIGVVVGADEADAGRTIEWLKEKGLPQCFEPSAARGFSEFIGSRGAERFLSQGKRGGSGMPSV
jgi:hypothetical protein